MANGFKGGAFGQDRLWGLYPGVVVNRDDPERIGRIKVSIPGLIDDESNWAFPRTGASVRDASGAVAYRGEMNIPPVGADVFVQFVNGDVDKPVWEPGPYGLGEAFPEHESADVAVWGVGPFRLVIDTREGVETAVFKIVKTISGQEESVCELEFNAATNSVRLWATTALQLAGDGIVDVDSTGAVQVRQRKVMPVNRPIN